MPEIVKFFLLQTIALLLTALLIPRFKISGPLSALGMVIALGVVNSTIWDAALFFQVPNSLTSQAVTILVANGVLFWVLVKLLPGIESEGLLAALLAPIVFSVMSVLVYNHGKDIDWVKVWERIETGVTGFRDKLIAGENPIKLPPQSIPAAKTSPQRVEP